MIGAKFKNTGKMTLTTFLLRVVFAIG